MTDREAEIFGRLIDGLVVVNESLTSRMLLRAACDADVKPTAPSSSPLAEGCVRVPAPGQRARVHSAFAAGVYRDGEVVRVVGVPGRQWKDGIRVDVLLDGDPSDSWFDHESVEAIGENPRFILMARTTGDSEEPAPRKTPEDIAKIIFEAFRIGGRWESVYEPSKGKYLEAARKVMEALG